MFVEAEEWFGSRDDEWLFVRACAVLDSGRYLQRGFARGSIVLWRAATVPEINLSAIETDLRRASGE
jgi:hypothetical protein